MPNTTYPSQPGPLGYKPFGADYNSGTNTRYFTMINEAGSTVYYLWVDSSGRLRVKSGTPTTDTDGAIVGAQS